MTANNTLDPQYLALLAEIMENGTDSDDRTGIGTKSLFMRNMRINLKGGFPILTSRAHSFKVAFYETMMFLNGSRDSKTWLEDRGIKIWTGNTSREFLDKRGLTEHEVGDIGPVYGWQWRHFAGPGGVDQLRRCFDTLKNNPFDRRLLMTSWNPNQVDQMPLPSCHCFAQFYCRNNTLSCSFYMRSLDVYHGCGYDIMCYAIITHLFAKALGMEVGELIMTSADTHLYKNQFEVVAEQLKMPYFDLPKLEIKKDVKTLEDICSLEFEDLELVGYKNAGRLKKVDMAV